MAGILDKYIEAYGLTRYQLAKKAESAKQRGSTLTHGRLIVGQSNRYRHLQKALVWHQAQRCGNLRRLINDSI